ncbi:MAG TPA: DUF6789 family protein [Rugosimonospora sp.]|nr:DUF6789 family protein [Rugosimonospora sp.]
MGWQTDRPSPPQAPLPVRAALVGAALAFSTGAGLLAYFLSGLALPLGIAAALLATGTAAVLVWRRLSARQRATVRARAWVGIRAGAVATLAYDLTRVTVTYLFGLRVNPFAALPVFGQLLIAQPSASPAAKLVGLLYHLANGIGFGTAYALLAAGWGVPAGVAFALLLEAAMLAFYPGWLDIRAIGEFFSMSLAGHLAYGATLGWLSRRLVHGRPLWWRP